ncbi:hypothetical protein C7B77_17315 [Chamaesiphon polymorphus CCALA 037]|uniref:Uncharacterized protein n=1 Tax=Chamaesiphon polymorphus CCALA 037 TaxID=2107692 RepID=A0A2T1GBL4_9CYAN|nr:hypothetical protein C7B77_17315 [Chamaesiphon polymorphus CCALA 037]
MAGAPNKIVKFLAYSSSTSVQRFALVGFPDGLANQDKELVLPSLPIDYLLLIYLQMAVQSFLIQFRVGQLFYTLYVLMCRYLY